MVFVIGDLVCTVMVLVGLVVLLFLLLLPKIGEWRRGQGDTKGMLVAVMLALIVVTGSYTVWLVLDYRDWTTSRELEYNLNITAPADAIGVVLVPVTVNEDLRDVLEASPGASIELVDTEHGEALKVVFQGNVSVHGRLERTEDFDDYRMTMFSRTVKPGVQRYWFHFDGGDTSNGTVGVELRLVHNSIYLWESYRADLVLEEGWAERNVLGEYEEWYYG
jgi:hypothetical protein